jgi:hypothetical protein
MRRYKCVDIIDIGFIERCIYLWLDGKKGRADVQHFLSRYTSLTYRQVCKMMRIGVTDWLPDCIEKIADDVQKRLIDEKLDLPEIEFKDKYDDVCGKWRRIGIQKPIHQIFDYVAVEACKEMFMAKIGPYQMASIPGRGQEKGARQIQKWIQLDPKHCRYWVKGDIRKCYPSIPQDRIKARFARDIKNPKLLWLICELIDSFPEGLSIGSYFSQFACNYYLSYTYHYIGERLYKVRRKKNGDIVCTRLVYHQIWFMDDVLLLGSSERDLKMAMELLTEEMHRSLGLMIKPGWVIETTDYIGPDGKHHGRDIDMMGYRVYCDHIAIRRRTFRRHRRGFLRAKAKIAKGKDLGLKEARRLMSFKGKFDNSDSKNVSKRLRLLKVMHYAGKMVSAYDSKKQKMISEERRAWDENNRTCSRKTAGNAVCTPPGWTGGRMDEEKHYAAALPF